MDSNSILTTLSFSLLLAPITAFLLSDHPKPSQSPPNSTIETSSDSKKKKYESKRVIDQIGERMKRYEKSASMVLDPSLPIIARLDGHKFSSFTRGFKKPYDERISKAMIETTKDLVENFNPVFAFTQSDEITLVFAPVSEGGSMLHGGKNQKLASVLASYCTARFQYHISQCKFEASESNLKQKVDEHKCYFDGRVFNVPSKEEALNNVMWRASFDCRRNAVFAVAQTLFSTKELLNLGTTALIKKMKEEKGVDFESYPDFFKYGTFVKREAFEAKVIDQKTKEEITVTRTRCIAKSFDLGKFSQENIDMIFNKYW